MQSIKILNQVFVLILISSTLTVAKAQKIEISDEQKEFVKKKSISMVVYNDAYTHCALNVMRKNKKFRKAQRNWVNDYWPTTLELVHYSSKIHADWAASFKKIPVEEVDLFGIQNRLMGVASKRARSLFDGKSKGEKKKFCKQLKPNSLEYSEEVSIRFRKLKAESLTTVYGNYDGAAEYQAIKDSLK